MPSITTPPNNKYLCICAITLFGCVCLGWGFSSITFDEYRRRVICARLEQLGAFVDREDVTPHVLTNVFPFLSGTITRVEEVGWSGTRDIRAIVAEIALLNDVGALNLESARFEESDLTVLSSLRGVRTFVLSSSNISDFGVRALLTNNEIESIDLSWTRITDNAFCSMPSTTRLQKLDLSWTQISDNGIRHIKKLPRIENLSLDGTDITNEGLIQLADHPSITQLSLCSCANITWEGLSAFRGNKRITTLILMGPNIDDRCAADLESLVNLEHLDLSGTHITDLTMFRLCHLKRLKSLSIGGTAITDAGFLKLSEMQLNVVYIKNTAVTEEAARKVQDQKKIMIYW